MAFYQLQVLPKPRYLWNLWNVEFILSIKHDQFINSQYQLCICTAMAITPRLRPGQASHCDGRTIQRARRSKSARWIAVDAQHLASEINERAKDAAWDGLAW